MANVTYLIGAGASAQAIPTVGKSFNKRFIEFIHIVNTFYPKDPVKEFLSKVIKELPRHYSIDTYARKLSFQNGNSYKAIKTLISYYLLFEQMQGYTAVNGRPRSIVTSEDNTYAEILDPRYDVLYAALLDGAGKKLPSNVNFISWNYDAQFELSLSEFLGQELNYSYSKLNVFPSPNAKTPTDAENAQIVKLNGTAGLYYAVTTDASECPYKYYCAPGSTMHRESFEECIKILYSHLIGEETSSEEMLHFSWEDKLEIDLSRKRAINIIKNTDILVVIGYSFPVYNRLVDREIFKDFHNTKVYLQVLKQDVEAYTERFKSIVKPNTIQGEVIPRYDLDQFFIPYELL